VIEHPERVAIESVINDANMERRRVVMSHIGFERILATVPHTIVDQTPEGVLYHLELPRRPVRVLEVRDATNPNEQFCIPASVRFSTVRDVRAASFGMTSDEFQLIGES